MNFQDFFRTLSGPTYYFQDYIYRNEALHRHEINQRITSKIYLGVFKLHQNVFEFEGKKDDFSCKCF